jgi:hypothetical protein
LIFHLDLPARQREEVEVEGAHRKVDREEEVAGEGEHLIK